MMLRDLLTDNGFQAEISTDPREALERLRDQHYDLVVADYKMPVIDGSEFLIKARKSNPGLPVIMVSGLMNMPELLKVANIGVTLVLEKPFDTKEFLSNVSKFVDPVPQTADEVVAEEPAAFDEDSPLSEDSDDPRVWSYPRPTKYVADQSLENKQLLQLLHDYIGKHRHLLIECSSGSEIERLEQEISDWKSVGSESRQVRFHLHELQADAAKSQLLQNLSACPAIVVSVAGRAEDRDRMGELIAYIDQNAGEDASGSLVFQLPPGWLGGIHHLPVKTESSGTVVPRILYLADLVDRPADIAEYAYRMTRVDPGPTEARRWTPRAVDLLLTHTWRNNFRELNACILRCMALSRDSLQIDEPLLIDALRLRISPDALPQDGLEEFLTRRQARFLQQLVDNAEDPRQALSDAGIDPESYVPGVDFSDQPLLYPDLLADPNLAVAGSMA